MSSGRTDTAPGAGLAYGESAARWVLAATVLGSSLTFVDATVVNIAMPTIGKDLDAGLSGLTWTVNAYTLTLACLILVVYQQYVTDLIDGVNKALTAVDPTPFFTKYGNNSWAAVETYQAAQVDYAAAPVIKYTGVLAAADVYTASTAFILLESIRLDLGVGSQVHP